MALIDLGLDQWSVDCEASENLAREIMTQFSARSAEHPGSYNFDSITGKIRVRLRQLTKSVVELRNQLQGLSNLTGDEKERRMRLVENLESRVALIENELKAPGAASSSRVIQSSGWADDDDDELIDGNPNNLASAPIADLRSQQTRMLEDQDAGLGQLSQVIARQKQIALAITDEVDEQSVLLDGIATDMDNVNARVRGETDLIRTLSRKDSTCGYWVVILILMLAIIAVIAAPGR